MDANSIYLYEPAQLKHCQMAELVTTDLQTMESSLHGPELSTTVIMDMPFPVHQGLTENSVTQQGIGVGVI